MSRIIFFKKSFRNSHKTRSMLVKCYMGLISSHFSFEITAETHV